MSDNSEEIISEAEIQPTTTTESIILQKPVVITSSNKKRKGNLNLEGVDDLNIYLPNEYKKLIDLINFDFSLKEFSKNINDYYLCYYNKNVESEINNDESYLNALKYFDRLDLKERIIYIKPKSKKEENNEKSEEEKLDFNEYIENIVSTELSKFGKNVKALLLNGDVMDTRNKFKINNNIHEERCINCKHEPITGNLYRCVVEEEAFLCSKCVGLHEHPSFKIP
jgi:hypothetical protein